MNMADWPMRKQKIKWFRLGLAFGCNQKKKVGDPRVSYSFLFFYWWRHLDAVELTAQLPPDYVADILVTLGNINRLRVWE